VYRLTWRLPLAGLVAFSHLQFSQIRGRQPYSIVRKIPYLILYCHLARGLVDRHRHGWSPKRAIHQLVRRLKAQAVRQLGIIEDTAPKVIGIVGRHLTPWTTLLTAISTPSDVSDAAWFNRAPAMLACWCRWDRAATTALRE
jgi:hypothetical protein